MIRTLEAAVFGAAAAALHLAAFLAVGERGGAPAEAGAPAALVVAGASPALAALVEQWDNAPPFAEAPARPPAPAEAAAPAPPVHDAAPVDGGAPVLPPPDGEAVPERPQPPAPLAEPPPRPEPRPPARTAGRSPAPEPASAPPDPPAAAATPPAPGAAGTSPAPTALAAPAADRAGLAAELGAAVRAAIARAQRYPARARDRGQQGSATLQVTIARDGRLDAARLVRSSGAEVLDAAALAAARGVGRYPAAPAELPGARFTFEVSVAFVLD